MTDTDKNEPANVDIDNIVEEEEDDRSFHKD
jgi:hypothetical protein